ncbi:1499_t:CDS:2, partial [Entrophospora sp. SA101]
MVRPWTDTIFLPNGTDQSFWSFDNIDRSLRTGPVQDWTDLDVLHIHDEITHHYLQKSSTLLEPPNVVILKAGPEPNSDKNVFATCDLFEEDLLSNDTEVKNGYDKRLDIVADEAIFRRLVCYKKGHPKVFPMLGQFHTNKEMLAVLISAFSGYGIFNIAAKLGSRFLDKLDD